MPAINVLLADGLAEEGQVVLRSAAAVRDRRGLSHEDLLRCIQDYEALIVRSRTRVSAEVFARAERLKVVGRAGVGVDNIDLEAAERLGVTVVNAPTATSLAVAEHTMALLLALARHLPRADAGMKAGDWLKKDLLGVELHGKALGILGVGRIGMEVGMRASAFGMRVLGYDPFLQAEEIRKRGVQPEGLDGLYAQADFLSLHLPLQDDTRGMLNEAAFARMKPGVRLVCAARGGIIEEDDLLRALRSGKVGGAALDVFAHEPPGKTQLIMHPNVIASPHLGAQTAEAQIRAAVDIASEVLAALRGEPLRWKVI